MVKRNVAPHLNKLRWVVLSAVFSMLLLIPYLHVYQNYAAAHAYDLLEPSEQALFDVMATLSDPFVSDVNTDLDVLTGTTWSGNLFGLKLSDPLAVAGQGAAGRELYLPFALTALIPLLLSVCLGRFFCGWICPATLLYELNSNLAAMLHRAGFSLPQRHLDRRLKYVVLVSALVVCALSGSVLVAAVYPPAIIGREIYQAVALGGFGAGALFFLATLLFDLLVARRGFCRYVCPGGALYSILGRYRALRIGRTVARCNDCAKCNAVCEFALNPMRDDFGQECNNCTACIAVCPTDALSFRLALHDQTDQGCGSLSHSLRRSERPVSDVA